MKKVLQDFLPVSFLNTIVSLLLIYIVASSWLSDGYTQMEVAMLSLIPGIIFFSVIMTGNLVLLSQYRKNKIADNERILPWGYQFLLLSVSAIVMAIILDVTYYQVDKEVPLHYANAMHGVISDSVNNDETVVNAFGNLPFFLQGAVINIALIILANLISIPFTLMIVKKEQFSKQLL